MFLLQMAGWMGTGKSTIARAVATATGAIVLDHDTTKTALLEAGVPHPPAGGASYGVVQAIAADLLSQGCSVIIDSPSLYESIPEIGAAIAAQADARYLFVECQCPDEIAEHANRVRANRVSQVSTAAEARSIRRSESSPRPSCRSIRPGHHRCGGGVCGNAAQLASLRRTRLVPIGGLPGMTTSSSAARLPVVVCANLVIDRDSLLLVRESKPSALQRWSLPVGKLEPGETLRQGAEREALEETGVTVAAGPLVGIYHCLDTLEGGSAINFVFRSTVIKGAITATKTSQRSGSFPSQRSSGSCSPT